MMSPIISLTRNEEVKESNCFGGREEHMVQSEMLVLEKPLAVRPEPVRPMALKPAIVRPDPTRLCCPEPVGPEVVRPAVVKPDVVRPGVVRPMVVRPDVVRPEVIRPSPEPLRPLAVKPVAMKVANPVPQNATDKFYKEAHKHGIPALDVHMAVMESHDWHRKWTQQDEEGHTMPEPQQQKMDELYSSSVPDFLLDRNAGARNPILDSQEGSPESSFRRRIEQEFAEDEEVLRVAGVDGTAAVVPRHVTVWESDCGSYSTMCDSYSTWRDSVHEEDDELNMVPPPTFGQTDAVVRPVALRVMPQAMSMSAAVETDEIPQQIDENRVALGGNVSPLTHVSGTQNVGISTGEAAADHFNDIKLPASFVEEDFEVMSQFDMDDQDDSLFELPAPESPRDALLHELVVNGGDGANEKFQAAINPLAEEFKNQKIDTCVYSTNGKVEGSWLTLTKPTFFGNLGENDNGDPLYTLGRMSFDMFSPTGLVCSLQGNFNQIEFVDAKDRQAMLDSGLVPKSLREEVENEEVLLRTYNVMTAFTIEPPMAAYPDAPNKDVHRPIRGIMHTYGYTIPDPEVPNRHSIWITGGRIEPNDCLSDMLEWKRLFQLHPPKHSFGEKAKLLAVKLLMGANVPEKVEEDGSLTYSFTRPLGGHGVAYVDVVYMDGSLRIVKGHRGTIFVFTRMESNQKYLS